jgi:putative NADH-flavin reductase
MSPIEIGGVETAGMKKRILVLGATGPTGREVVKQALEAGHEVTAFVRSPAKLAMTHDRLGLATGDVTADGPALADAMRGKDAVICALGSGQSLAPHALMEQAMPRIVAAMRETGVKRFVLMSAFGVGETFAEIPVLPRILVRTLLARIYADKEAGEKVLKRSNLDWTVVYPTGLTNGPRTENFRFGEHLKLHGLPTVSRADVAKFLVEQVDDDEYVRKGVLLSS